MTQRQTKQAAGPRLSWFGLPKLAPYLRPYRGVFVTMLAMGFLGSVGDVILPLFQQYALDTFVAGQTLRGVGVFAAVYIAVLAVQVVLNTLAAYRACEAEMYIGRDLRRAAFNHLQTLSLAYFNANSVGYIHARVMSDTERIGGMLAWGCMDSVWHGSYIVGAVAAMLFINWKLALVVLVLAPVVAGASAYFQKKLLALNRRVREINSRITGGFNEGITGAKTTKTLVIEEKMQAGFETTTREMHAAAVRAGRVRAAFQSAISFSAALALALVLWRGGLLTLEGVLTVGTLSVFMSYAQGLMEPIQWIVNVLANLATIQVNIERFDKLMRTEPNVQDTPEVIAAYGDCFDPKPENWEPLHGDVEFDHVTFRYPDGEETVLEDFCLKVPQGTNVAIVGETGAGKSTLVNLACRFFEPTEGRVLIDGVDVRARSQLWLHRHIGYVLQTPHLFSGTVLENLRYGNPNATMEQIEAAVRAVHAEEMIARMPKGYDSDVGEGGDLLSTGEKQLLSFARAILADPRIFVLDEATSSVDTRTEQAIQQAIETLMQGRTSFVIAHRLSTIRHADVILVVQDGRIVERGTHSELLAQKGYYYKLYTRQYEEQLSAQVLR